MIHNSTFSTRTKKNLTKTQKKIQRNFHLKNENEAQNISSSFQPTLIFQLFCLFYDIFFVKFFYNLKNIKKNSQKKKRREFKPFYCKVSKNVEQHLTLFVSRESSLLNGDDFES